MPGRTAYVLDGDIQIGNIISQILAEVGFVARAFSNPVPFLAEIRVVPPELVILDLRLEQSDAVEMIHHLEALKFSGKTLLMSRHHEMLLFEIEQIGQRHGLAMLPSLPKPFRSLDLKNRLATFSSPKAQAANAENNKPLAIDLHQALQQRWLELWYQPKVCLKTMSVGGAEALIRVRHPKHGIVSPNAFLPPSSDPLHEPLSRFVIGKAMSDWGIFCNAGMPLKLAVNVPTSIVLAPQFIAAVRELLPRNPTFPGLTIEITEDEMIKESEILREIAAQLKLYNVSIATDDFGSAYSSLSRLRDLPCSELKLDRSFVEGCSRDGAKKLRCFSTIALAHSFGLTVCAEGVESIEDLRVLKEMQCDTAQGYLFAKPMDRNKFIEHLRSSDLPGRQLSSA
jgi:EAL domain-containing protein (putative c-di-GMP-specific phosphodiesterase class I)